MLNLILLTDHRSHIKIDSFYDIVNNLYSKKFFNIISVASRGISENKLFFNSEDNKIYVKHINKKIRFQDNWEDDLIPIDFNEYDVVLLRLDQPISEFFLKNLKIRYAHIIFINDPSGMSLTNSKEFLLKFSEYIPNILLLSKYDKIKNLSQNKEIVIKPIKSYGGKGISRIYKDKAYIENNIVSIDTFKKHIQELILIDKKVLVMDYLKNINQGDKRIIIVNGKVLGSFLRMPPDNKWICNVSQGANIIKSELEVEEKKIIEKVNPVLREQGIIIYGIDTIADNNGKRVLSEINTANVGGFSILETLYHKPIFSILTNKIIEYIDAYKKDGY